MRSPERICYHCMAELPQAGGLCPKCGWDNAVRESGDGYLRAGVLNGQYFVGQALGRGGFGITYRGYDLNLNREVAIKEYFPMTLVLRRGDNATIAPFADSKEQFAWGKKRALEEGGTTASLSRVSNTVQVHNAFEANGTVYIVMEYVEGTTLSRLVQERGRISWPEAYGLMKPIMIALEAIHQRGIIHRDVSPDNIMLRADSAETVLLDFGAARSYGDEKQGMTGVVHPGYAPPEQYSSMAKQDARTDEYALCATLYHLLTGVKPPASDEIAFGGAVLTPPRKLGVDMPEMAEAALLKGMSVQMDERYPTVSNLRAAFDEANAGGESLPTLLADPANVTGKSGKSTGGKKPRPESSKPESSESEPPKQRRKPRGILGLVAAVVIAFLLGAALVAFLLGSRLNAPVPPEPGDSPESPEAVILTPTATIAPEENTPTPSPTPTPTSTPTLEPSHLPASQLPGADPSIPVPEWPELRSEVRSEEEGWPTAVFGSGYSRDSISSITFTGSLADANGDAWDVSAAGDGSVLAWVIPTDEGLYDLVIAGEGGVRAPENCWTLFSDYVNLETVRFNGCFDTSEVTEMTFMFAECYSLRRLDLSSFDTSRVESLGGIFHMCRNLEEVDLTSFDTSRVYDMEGMFDYCESLKELDLTSFDTHNVTSMIQMFCGCTSLRAIYTSPDFVINGAMDMMFEGCPVQGIN